MRKILSFLILFLLNSFPTLSQNPAEQMLEKLVMAGTNKMYGMYEYSFKIKTNSKDTIFNNSVAHFDKRNKLKFHLSYSSPEIPKSLWINHSIEYKINHVQKT